MLTDPERVANLEARAGAYRERVGKRLQRARLVRADGSRDTKAAARAMVAACAKVGREVALTPKERTALDRDACILSGSRVLKLYAEYTGTGSLWSRVATLKEGFEQPLQTRFDPLKETGRTSSTQPSKDSALKGDQMQNHARAAEVTSEEKKRERKGEFFIGTRECYRPRDGNVFVGADYTMAELHTVSQLCVTLFGYSKLADLLRSGMDAHCWLAAKTLGFELAKEDVPRFKKERKIDRDRAKPGNFGFWGGMGGDKFVLYSRKGYGVRFTVPEAKTFKQQWRDAFPETGAYFAWISRQLGDRDTFTHVHPITGFVRGDCWYTDGCNHGFQHLAAYGAGDAIALVGAACETEGSPLFGWSMWNFVHDEILLEGPLAGAHDAAIELKRLMEQAFNRYVPDVPLKAEPFVTYIWSKKAELCRDNVTGRIVPWTPQP